MNKRIRGQKLPAITDVIDTVTEFHSNKRDSNEVCRIEKASGVLLLVFMEILNTRCVHSLESQL